jgi:hypothetical protein
MIADFLEFDEEGLGPEPLDDPAVARATSQLRKFFSENPQGVFYENQLCIFFEDASFHWVTSRALKMMRLDGEIGSELQHNPPHVTLRFYFHRRNRYWKRRAAEIRKLVQTFSEQSFTESLGQQGETMIDAGLPRVGFMPVARDVRTWQGWEWTQTGHDLDRVFTRDGVHYGAEIKNKLSYIDQAEFRAKLAMCNSLRLIPLFVARMMPKTYIKNVTDAGGFVLLMKYQFYPFAHRSFARTVASELALPVDCPACLSQSTLDRFLNWHLRKLGHPPKRFSQ